MLVLCNGHDLTYLWELQCSLTPFITSIVMLLVSLQLTTVLGSATAANLHGSYTTIQDLCFQNSSLLLLINCTVFMLNCIVPCFFMHTYVRFIVLGRSGLRRIQAACGWIPEFLKSSSLTFPGFITYLLHSMYHLHTLMGYNVFTFSVTWYLHCH